MILESIKQALEQTGSFLLPLITAYHLISSSVFLNTAAEDAQGLEKWGDALLAPVQYLLAAESAYPSNDPNFPYMFRQRFDYDSNLFIKTTACLVALPLSLALGSSLKGLSFLNADTLQRHKNLIYSRSGPLQPLSIDRYEKIGVDPGYFKTPTMAASLNYERRSEAQDYFKEEKKAFEQILDLLKTHGIICWADCGTCLGAYQYGGVIPWDFDLDIAILQSDFIYVKRVLNTLPSEKYLVEDWSSRFHPETLLKVCIRETGEYIDIYNFALDSDNHAVHFILSNEDNFFLSDSWKTREKHFTIDTPLDWIFPLKTALFDGIEVPVPYETEKYLAQRYGSDLRPAKIYDEKSSRYIKNPDHPYWKQAHVH